VYGGWGWTIRHRAPSPAPNGLPNLRRGELPRTLGLAQNARKMFVVDDEATLSKVALVADLPSTLGGGSLFHVGPDGTPGKAKLTARW